MSFQYYSDSLPEFSENFTLEGMWIHDPDDPQNTVRNYRYGKNRGSSIDTQGKSHAFAGRRYPVFEYGEHQEDKVSVNIIVDHGPDYQERLSELTDFAQLKKPIVYRDNRGRSFYGVISGFGDSDNDHGSNVTFTVSRAYREEVNP